MKGPKKIIVGFSDDGPKGQVKIQSGSTEGLAYLFRKINHKSTGKKHLTRPSTCEKSRPVSLAASSNELEERLPEKLITRGCRKRIISRRGTTPRPPGPSPVSCPVSFPGLLCHLHSLVSPSHCSESSSQ